MRQHSHLLLELRRLPRLRRLCSLRGLHPPLCRLLLLAPQRLHLDEPRLRLRLRRLHAPRQLLLRQLARRRQRDLQLLPVFGRPRQCRLQLPAFPCRRLPLLRPLLLPRAQRRLLRCVARLQPRAHRAVLALPRQQLRRRAFVCLCLLRQLPLEVRHPPPHLQRREVARAHLRLHLRYFVARLLRRPLARHPRVLLGRAHLGHLCAQLLLADLAGLQLPLQRGHLVGLRGVLERHLQRLDAQRQLRLHRPRLLRRLDQALLVLSRRLVPLEFELLELPPHLEKVLALLLQLLLQHRAALPRGVVQLLRHAQADLLQLARRNNLLLDLLELFGLDVELSLPRCELRLALFANLANLRPSCLLCPPEARLLHARIRQKVHYPRLLGAV